jgi:hypothetical protein
MPSALSGSAFSRKKLVEVREAQKGLPAACKIIDEPPGRVLSDA